MLKSFRLSLGFLKEYGSFFDASKNVREKFKFVFDDNK